MKKLVYLILGGLLAFTACRHRADDPDIAVTGLKLSNLEVTLEIGELKQLSATVSPPNATDPTVAWQSSAPGVATVTEEGLVKALSVGTATVTAQAGKVTASCSVTVKEPFVAVTSVSLDHRSLLLPQGNSKQLELTVLPENATDPSASWASSDPAVVRVEGGVLTALAEGSATITVSVGDLQARCEVVVIPPGPDGSQIWYTSWTDDVLHFGKEEGCGAHIVSNVYSDGKGVITFDGEVTDIPAGLFSGKTGLKSISLPHTVRNLASDAFRDCSTMLTVSLQEGLTQIGGNAFSGCFSLRKIDLPSTLVSIGEFMLQYCDLITTLTLPENLTNLDSFALYGCAKLTSLTVLCPKPGKLGFRALDETGNCPIYVPASAVDKYKKADGWKDYASRIQAIPE